MVLQQIHLSSKSGRDPEDVYQELIEAGIPDISMEVVDNVGEMYNEGIRLFRKVWRPSTIKLPCTRDGLQVCRHLTAKDIRTNVTLIFSAFSGVGAKVAKIAQLTFHLLLVVLPIMVLMVLN